MKKNVGLMEQLDPQFANYLIKLKPGDLTRMIKRFAEIVKEEDLKKLLIVL